MLNYYTFNIKSGIPFYCFYCDVSDKFIQHATVGGHTIQIDYLISNPFEGVSFATSFLKKATTWKILDLLQWLPQSKYLAAFDFDHTVISQNSDIVARDLIPTSYAIPDRVKQLYDANNGWTEYMGEIFKILHEFNINKIDILSAITSIPEVNGMVDLFRNLVKLNFDIIIISDSNSAFIHSWCEANGIAECISSVYTNPGDFNENELLTIQPFHKQTTCQMSQMNLCKGQVLEEHIGRNTTNGSSSYDKVFYIGDGANDYCPITKLNNLDFGCARKGYKLEKLLTQSSIIKAETIIWENGLDLCMKIKEKL